MSAPDPDWRVGLLVFLITVLATGFVLAWLAWYFG